MACHTAVVDAEPQDEAGLVQLHTVLMVGSIVTIIIKYQSGRTSHCLQKSSQCMCSSPACVVDIVPPIVNLIVNLIGDYNTRQTCESFPIPQAMQRSIGT